MVIKAIGNSLNRAKNVAGGPIKNGDYVIVDCNNKNPQNGDYVLSIIDEAANFKRFYREGDMIKLVSESSEEYPPIYIHESEMDEYTVNGVVVRVIKK
jgi:repressor LexA